MGKINTKSFLTLSPKESKVKYQTLINNSDKKWLLCEQHITNNEYDIAASLAIISIEELVKAMIVYANVLGFEFGRSKEMERFFKDHSIRFLIALVLFVIDDLGKDFFSIILKIREDPTILTIFRDNLNNIDSFIEQDLKPYYDDKIRIYKTEFEWFSTLEALRQEGFYYDYKEPSILNFTSEQKCNEVYGKLKIVRIIGKGYIRSYENNESNWDHLTQIIEEWRIKDYYKKVDDSLIELKKLARNPFDAIRKKLT